MTRKTSIAFALMTLVGMSSSPVSAQSPIFNCTFYAARAISQLQMGAGCPGAQGGRWSPNLRDHLNWCQGKSQQDMQNEDSARRAVLASCTGFYPGNVAFGSCEEYVGRVMSQVDLQDAKHCNFNGARWSRQASDHMTWCRAQGLSSWRLASEDKARRMELFECGRRTGTTTAAQGGPPPVVPRPTPAPAPTPAPTSIGSNLSAADAQAILNAHNAVRARHCVPAMTWSPQAAASAQQIANTCPVNNVLAHEQQSTYGENLALGTGWTAQNSFDAWYGEIRNYNFIEPVYTRSPAVGHFTQIVWRTTTQFGCAMNRCGTDNYWVCRYLPPGNMNVEVSDRVTPEIARQSLLQNVLQLCR